MQSILTVVTPAESVDLTILANVKAELGITGSAEDANLETWIDQASGVCAQYCNRVFGAETVMQTFYNPSSRQSFDSILLARNPVTDIDSVTVDGELLTVDVDYTHDAATGKLFRLSGDSLVDWSFRKLVVEYTAGYELLGTLPINIERACILLVKSSRSNATRDSLVKSESIPGVLDTTYWVDTTGQAGSVPPDVAALLDPYRDSFV